MGHQVRAVERLTLACWTPKLKMISFCSALYSATLPPPFVCRVTYGMFKASSQETYDEFRRRGQRTTGGMQSIYILQTMKPAIEHGVAPSLWSCTPISLQEVALKVNYIHKDRVVFVRIVGEGFSEVATNVLVEDEVGDSIMLSLYNYRHEDDVDIQDILPLGGYLALLNPYMKNARDDRDRILMLRCDNPQCVLRFDSIEELYVAMSGAPRGALDSGSNPIRLKEQGNEAFHKGLYVTALGFYESALKCINTTTEDRIASLSNIAEVCLRRGMWEQAAKSATSVLEFDSSHQKARFRLARALVRLGRIDEASEMTKQLRVKEPKNKYFLELSRECDRLLVERSGVFNVPVMLKETNNSGCRLRRNHADYVSPKISLGVELCAFETHGSKMTYRGTVAKANISANELLCSSTAFAFAEAIENNGCTMMQVDAYASRLSTSSEAKVFTEVVKLLHRRPVLCSEFFSLSSGSDEVETKSDKIDLPLIRRILNVNMFASRESWGARPSWLSMKSNDKSDDKSPAASGLWLNESLFNHSCSPNCDWATIGDKIFIHSSRSIDTGEELCISYAPIEESHSKKTETFASWIGKNDGFACHCERCRAIDADPELRRATQQIEDAFQESIELVNNARVPMGNAAEQTLSSSQRHQLISILNKYPLNVQNEAGRMIHVMDGAYWNECGGPQRALKCFEMAKDIGEATRGTRHLSWAKDLWRVVGCSMRCNNKQTALANLNQIWRSPLFVDAFVSTNEAKEAFRDMTLHYSLPWWLDRQSEHRMFEMLRLVEQVLSSKGSAVQPGKSGSFKKKKGKKKYH